MSETLSGNSSVGIIGCGWLGTPLAKQLQKNGYAVLATATSDQKCALLAEQNIAAQTLTLPTEQIPLNQHPVFNCQSIVIAITPGFKQGRKDYADKITQLVSAAKAGDVQQIILLSSTGVYGGLTGVVDEVVNIEQTDAKAHLLYQAEQAALIAQASGDVKQVSVLRLAGLVGKNRQPAKFLAGKQGLTNAEYLVHLIHQQDVINIINQFIDTTNYQEYSGIFNCVSPTNATRQQFYLDACQHLGLPAPQFSEQQTSASKKIIGNKVTQLLGYQFVYPDLMAWLKVNSDK